MRRLQILIVNLHILKAKQYNLVNEILEQKLAKEADRKHFKEALIDGGLDLRYVRFLSKLLREHYAPRNCKAARLSLLDAPKMQRWARTGDTAPRYDVIVFPGSMIAPLYFLCTSKSEGFFQLSFSSDVILLKVKILPKLSKNA